MSIKIEMSFRPCLCRIRQLAEQAGIEPESHHTLKKRDRGSMPAMTERLVRQPLFLCCTSTIEMKL